MSNMKLSAALETIVPMYFRPSHAFLSMAHHFSFYKRITGIVSILRFLILAILLLFIPMQWAFTSWALLFSGPWIFWIWFVRNKRRYDRQINEVIQVASVATGINLKRDKSLEELIVAYYIDYLVKDNIAWL